MNVFVRIRYSQAFRLVPSVKPANPRKARRYVSCSRSSASDGFLVSRSAAPYSPDRRGSASRSNRSLRCRSSDSACATSLLLNDHLVQAGRSTVLRRTDGAGLDGPRAVRGPGQDLDLACGLRAEPVEPPAPRVRGEFRLEQGLAP